MNLSARGIKFVFPLVWHKRCDLSQEMWLLDENNEAGRVKVTSVSLGINSSCTVWAAQSQMCRQSYCRVPTPLFQHWRHWINDESIGGDIHQLTSSSCLSSFLRVQLIKIACFIETEFSCTSPKGESKLLFWFIEHFPSWIQIRNLFCLVVYNVQTWFEKPEVKYFEC